jgi:hypothetical protein
LIRIVAVLAAVSVLSTLWFISAFAAAGGLRPLLTSGLLGGLTIVGWVITLVLGPVAAVQLWRFRVEAVLVPSGIPTVSQATVIAIQTIVLNILGLALH